MIRFALILALAMSAFAQDELPGKIGFAGVGWTARQASPTTGFAGVGIKVTDKIGGLYQWNSLVATSKTNSFASGFLKPVGTIGPFTGYVVGQAGIASGDGIAALTYGGGALVTMPAKLLLYLPTRILGNTGWLDNFKGTFFAGAQVNQINGPVGMPLAGVNISPGFGFAFPWGK